MADTPPQEQPILRKQMPDGRLKNYTRNYQTLLASAYPETR